jgi:hypothetical protein
MKRAFLAVALCATALAGCAGGLARLRGEDAGQRYVQYAGTPIEKFAAFRFDGWTPVSRNQLVVWTGVNEAYLLTVWDSCRDLQFANRVGVSSTTRTVSRFEHVTVGRDRCPISEIRPIDVRQMKADRLAERGQ